MSGFTEEQISQLSGKLARTDVKENPRGYNYIEAWHAIAEANRIFGFDRWSRETIDMKLVDQVETQTRAARNKPSRDIWRVAYVSKVRVTVFSDDKAVAREGTGFGQGFDSDLGLAHESAVKEAESDAMKRALMTFGNPFGLALYDKKQENVGSAADGVAMADTREMVQGFVKDPNPLPLAGTPDPIPTTTDRVVLQKTLDQFAAGPIADRLGPPQRRRLVPRETPQSDWPLQAQIPPQEAGAGEDQRMVPAPRLVEMASQAANKGMWALQEFCKVLEPAERASIKQIVVDQLQPIARTVDEKRNMQPRIDAELASRELADQVPQ